MFETFLKIMYKYELTIRILDVLSFIKRQFTINKISNSLLTNIEGIKEYNIPIKWFYEEKPIGISGVARLKNAEHFLELCIKSHLPFLDELILVDNLSTDKTKEICKKLEKEFPGKIKFYEYNERVFPPSEKNYTIPTNSVHSSAYYYNRCFSKAKYSHVMKVDDDNVLIAEKWNKIRAESLSNKNCYNIYRGFNLTRDKNGNFGTFKNREYSGKGGDHGVYPVSPYTYFIQGKETQVFVSKLRYKRFGFSFFHLKFLKPNFGFHNINDNNIIKKHSPSNSSFINLKKEYYKYINIVELDKNIDLYKQGK